MIGVSDPTALFEVGSFETSGRALGVSVTVGPAGARSLFDLHQWIVRLFSYLDWNQDGAVGLSIIAATGL